MADSFPGTVLGPAVADLLRSSRGLITLSDLCGEDVDVWSRERPGPLDDPTAHPFDERRPALAVPVGASTPGSTSLEATEGLAAAVLRSVRGHAWRDDRPLPSVAVERHGHRFAAAATELLGSPAAGWWDDDIDRGRQVMPGPADHAPDLFALFAEQERLLLVAGNGPPRALATSRRLGERLPAPLLADPEASYRWGDPVGVWAVTVPVSAHVYEVHGPQDWLNLCARHPRTRTPSDDDRRWGVQTEQVLSPDWSEVRESWDGVHISMQGLLSAVGVPVQVGSATGVLEDVDAELTFWLRPCLHDPELITTCTWESLF